jgi:N-acyl-D-aspartate/D-glutamate deacylase
MVTHWTRDRRRGRKLAIETVVRWHARDTARAVGSPTAASRRRAADLNVIDYDGLRLREPKMVRDLPAGGGRLLQAADGYRYAIVSGQVTYVNGEATGALPGRLVRGAQPAPRGVSA